MSTPPAVPRFLRFRWIFAIAVAILLVASVPFDLWNWWPRASGSQRLKVVSIVLAFMAFEAALLAMAFKNLIQLKYLIDESRRTGERIAPWWPIWIGKWKR